MAVSQGSLFSQTLQDITKTKLDDLATYRSTFESRRAEVLAAVEKEKDVIRALKLLADGVKTCFSINTSDGNVQLGATGYEGLEVELQNLDRFLAQARYDPSLSRKLLEQWYQALMKHLNVQSLKYSFASLYGQLTTEWLAHEKGGAAPPPPGEEMETEDFEHVDTARKLHSRQNWERSVFEPAMVNPGALTNLLKELFEPSGDSHALHRKPLAALRKAVKRFENELASPSNFDTESLKWIISGLLASDLLTDEKRAVLRDFENNSTFLKEIADVLNMRLAALSTWSWGVEVPVEERRQVNGSFRIYMHEDLLQAIFLQYLGVKWSVFWKGRFKELRNDDNVWISSTPKMSPETSDRLMTQIGVHEDSQGVQWCKSEIHTEHFFLTSLRDYETQDTSALEGEQEAEGMGSSFDGNMQNEPLQAPGQPFPMAQRMALPIVQMHQQRMQMAQNQSYSTQPPPPPPGKAFKRARGGFAGHSYGPAHQGRPLQRRKKYAHAGSKKSPMELREDLLHLLAADVQIKTRYRGEITCFRTQIQDLYPSLPHTAIEAILSFFGVSKKWLGFFMKFLRAPLRFLDDTDSKPRLRMRGTPGAHVLSEVFGELALFCMDSQVNQATDGEIMWRVEDDIWFWSHDYDVCVKAWTTIQSFAETMGLSLNNARSGSARISRIKSEDGKIALAALPREGLPKGRLQWGMLALSPESGRWEIDQGMVDKHIEELMGQLKGKTSSVFAWIQAWNTYAGTFFTTNFGPPALCLGSQHVDNVLETHRRIQHQVFGIGKDTESGSVTEFLKRTIEQRFGVSDIPDAYVFFPTELGGLEVHNPFLGLLQIRDSMRKDIGKSFAEFERNERVAYNARKKSYEDKLKAPQNNHSPMIKQGMPFMPFEEFCSYRETVNFGFSNELVDVYAELLQEPEEIDLSCDPKSNVATALSALDGELTRGLQPQWEDMQSYWKWVAQLYGPELIEQFGGFRIVDPGWLPMGIVSQFKSGRVKWKD